mmetsp:Transcript_12759/g.53997  ORF Transcript_12759/g.53997 Transcript_12759/m.53997 type:complete len:232 (-) Transcript_12759:1387-2082(-)
MDKFIHILAKIEIYVSSRHQAPPRNSKLVETVALGTHVSHGRSVLRAPPRDGNPEQRGRTRYQIRADIKTSVQSRANHRKRVCKANNSCLDSRMGSMKNYWHMQLYHTFSENSLGWILSLPRSVCTKRVLAHLYRAAGKKGSCESRISVSRHSICHYKFHRFLHDREIWLRYPRRYRKVDNCFQLGISVCDLSRKSVDSCILRGCAPHCLAVLPRYQSTAVHFSDSLQLRK